MRKEQKTKKRWDERNKQSSREKNYGNRKLNKQTKK
jgi:hypothetical protein